MKMKLTIKDLKTRNTSAVEVADDATFAALARLPAEELVPPWERAGSCNQSPAPAPASPRRMD